MRDISKLALIYSHNGYWRENSGGYTGSMSAAGIYDRAAAEKIAAGCGPEKGVQLCPVSEDHPAIMAEERDELRAALAKAIADRQASDRMAMEADEALNGAKRDLAEERARSKRWSGRYYELRKLTEAALPDNMGGYPDLFWPDGFNGSNDSDHPWELWQSAVQIEAKYVDAAEVEYAARKATAKVTVSA